MHVCACVYGLDSSQGSFIYLFFELSFGFDFGSKVSNSGTSEFKKIISEYFFNGKLHVLYGKKYIYGWIFYNRPNMILTFSNNKI